MNKKIWCTEKSAYHELYNCFYSTYEDIYKHIPKFVRCPDCNKRLQLKLERCQDTFLHGEKLQHCFHPCIPPHKAK